MKAKSNLTSVHPGPNLDPKVPQQFSPWNPDPRLPRVVAMIEKWIREWAAQGKETIGLEQMKKDIIRRGWIPGKILGQLAYNDTECAGCGKPALYRCGDTGYCKKCFPADRFEFKKKVHIARNARFTGPDKLSKEPIIPNKINLPKRGYSK